MRRRRRGKDGAVHKGGFVYLIGLYRGQYDFTTLHPGSDFDPGIARTRAVCSDRAHAIGGDRLVQGARMSASDVPLKDFFDIPNAPFRLGIRFQVPAT
jgi:hypothetical protein